MRAEGVQRNVSSSEICIKTHQEAIANNCLIIHGSLKSTASFILTGSKSATIYTCRFALESRSIQSRVSLKIDGLWTPFFICIRDLETSMLWV